MPYAREYLQAGTDQVDSIEIIPGSGVEWNAADPSNPSRPFLLSEGQLGVPEKILRKLYVDICRVYSGFNSFAMQEHPEETIHTMKLASSVALLANPEHQGALNFRKSCVVQGSSNETDELRLTTLILSIPRNAKSSILWHHRRWLLQRLFPAAILHTSTSHSQIVEWQVALPPEACRAEVDVIEKACECYRRNYHAWSHRAQLLQHMQRSCLLSSNRSEWIDLISEESIRTISWLNTHVSDHSAVHYLGQVNCAMLELELPKAVPIDPSSWENRDITMETLTKLLPWDATGLVCRYPSHEALWLSLRLACYIMRHKQHHQYWSGRLEQVAIGKYLDALVKQAPSAGAEGLHWVNEEQKQAIAHATRFLLWSEHQDNRPMTDDHILRNQPIVGQLQKAGS